MPAECKSKAMHVSPDTSIDTMKLTGTDLMNATRALILGYHRWGLLIFKMQLSHR